MKASGGCLCGQLRYEIDGDSMWAGNCYCEDCRKETGTGHLTALAVSGDAITVRGTAKSFARPGGSGRDVIRTFCSECGSTIFGQPTAMGDMRVVRVGTLDDPSGIELSMAVFCSQAQSWDQPPADIVAFPEMPPVE